MTRATRAGRDPLPLLTALVAAALCSTPLALWAEPTAATAQPLWEFGLGIGALGFEDYRGSATTHVYPVPVPYLLYNGTFLKADRQGVRGLLLNQDYVELSLSANITTPVRNDRVRSGMPELESTFELGPSVNVHLVRSPDAHIKLDLQLPLRSAFTVESPKFIGWTFTPRFNLDIADPLGKPGWNFGVLIGPLFADRRYNDYFYSVAPQFATLTRPAYQATGGYAGTQSVIALSKRFPKYWVGGYMRYDTLSHATFEPSPLVQRDSYWSAGIGIAWMIGKSSRTVNVAE